MTKTASDADCDRVNATLLTSPAGVISSVLSPSECPWTIRVETYQHVNISLVDFDAGKQTILHSVHAPATQKASRGPSAMTQLLVCTHEIFVSIIFAADSCILVHGQVTIIFIVSVGLSVCLFVCAVFLSRLCSDFDQTRTYVICLGLVVSPRI